MTSIDFSKEIQTLEDLQLSESLIFLIYGPSGCGKTHFACSAAHESRAFIINIGGGITTVKAPLFQRLYPKSLKTPIITITEETNPSSATGYDSVLKALDYMFNKHLDDFDTVVLDDITALRRFAMSKAIELAGQADLSKTRTKFSNSRVYKPVIQDYGLEMDFTESFLINLIANCREANRNLIATAHERIRYKKISQGDKRIDTDIIDKKLPGFTGKTFPDAVTGHFDCTWHAESIGAGDTIKFRMRTLGDEELTCNTKWGGIFKAIEPSSDFPKGERFDFPYVQKKIKQSIKKSSNQ